MEVPHRLDFAYSDLEPVFEECPRDLAGMLALNRSADHSGRPPA